MVDADHRAADAIVGLYRRHAGVWARDRGNRLFERPWLDRFLSLLPSHASILDIGCGSGEPISRYLIEQGCDVTGVDSSPELIAICQGHFPGRNWFVQDMRALSLARAFDGLLAWDSFFHLCPQDQRGMFAIFKAHAAPGAALMFTSGPKGGVAIGSYQNEPLYHASLDGAEYVALLNENGFEIIAHVVADPTCGAHTIWLAQRR